MPSECATRSDSLCIPWSSSFVVAAVIRLYHLIFQANYTRAGLFITGMRLALWWNPGNTNSSLVSLETLPVLGVAGGLCVVEMDYFEHNLGCKGLRLLWLERCGLSGAVYTYGDLQAKYTLYRWKIISSVIFIHNTNFNKWLLQPSAMRDRFVLYKCLLYILWKSRRWESV